MRRQRECHHRPATATLSTVSTRTVMPANKGSVSANGSWQTHMAPDSRARRTPNSRLLQQPAANHRNLQASGLYQHISLPRAVPAVKPASVQQWLREGDVERLRQLVTDGQGHRLLGEKPAQQSTRLFFRTLPGLMARQEELHAAAEAGRTDQVSQMLQSDPAEGARLAVSKDTAGLGLLHKAVLGGHIALANMLLDRFPQTLNLRDNEGRTALHYCGASPDPAAMWSMLETAGVDSEVVDRRGNRARHYMPKSSNLSSTRLGVTQAASQAAAEMPAVVTRAHIRKWIHERDLGKLEKLVWEGQGERLLPETSASPRVRRFLEAVPFILSIIKEVHSAAVTNNLSLWRMRTSPPVPTHLLVSQDKNGLTPLHKAAGLGHVEIVDEILQRSPKAATMKDVDNRSPLHYAAASRHQSASDVYRKLVEAGVDEKQADKKGKSASYYAEHPTELDTSSLLTVTPEAPRAPTKLPSQWNWGMLAMGVDTMLAKTMAVLPSIKPNRAAMAAKPRPSNSHPNLSKIQSINPPPLSTSNSHPDLSNSQRKTNNNKTQQKVKTNSDNTRNKQVNNNLDKSQKLVQSNLPEIPRTNPPNNTSTQQKSMNSQDKHDLNQETNTQNLNKSSTNVATNVPPKPNSEKQLSSTFPVGKIPTVAADPRRGVTQHTVATPATTFSFSPGALYQPPQTAPTRSEVSHFPGVPPGTAPSVLRTKEAHGEPAPVRPISPPGSRMPAPVLERWIRACDLGRLEDALLEGRGPRLLKLIASSVREQPVRTFVDRAPIFLEGMQRMHDAAIEGDEPTVRFLIDRYRRLVLARDEEGMQPMHVAARAGHEQILRVLLNVFPRGVAITDWEGRTPLHHAGMCPDLNKALTCYQLLLDHRAPEAAKDAIGNRASDYLSETRIQNPSVPEQRLDTPASVADSQNSGNRTIPQTPETNLGSRVGTAPNIPETPAAARIGTAPSETPAAANMTPDIIPQRDEMSRLPTAPLTTESLAAQSSEDLPDTPTSEKPPEYNSGTPDVPNENLVPPYSSPDFSDTPVVNSNKITPPEVTPNKADPIQEEARRLVEARDTEKLAELVLSGHGERLKGLTSSNPYVQGLLDNVPVYMDKIAAVHEAAARGDVAALQVALERRKFVTSRDKYGATPLHKAVLFLQVGVARYLGTRFPEALDAQDHAGRTSLHYAAVLPDRGALYRSLVALGADPRLRDKRGHTALDYQLHHEQRRNHEQLLNELGADPALAGHALDPARAAAAAAAAAVSLDMLQMPQPDPPKSRADVTRGSRGMSRGIQDGQYVTNSVGEPLLKGLMEVSSVRPKDPIAFLANYLYNFPHVSKREPGSVPSRVQTGYRSEETKTAERLETAGSMTSTAGSTNRDEHGQSMLHLAAARSHSRHAFSQLLREAGLSVGQRDALYRTPRDVALEAKLTENARDIDAWVLHLALEGDTTRLEELLLDGYDHILDVKDAAGLGILELVKQSNVQDGINFLTGLPNFEKRRDWIHRAIRTGSFEGVREMLNSARLAVARNSRGRCSLHVAVLCQQEKIAEFIATTFPITLSAGDNLERTPLHYAMAMDKAEILSMILVKAGARRTLKDLRGRQASFYFVNRGEMLQLREEELQEQKNSSR